MTRHFSKNLRCYLKEIMGRDRVEIHKPVLQSISIRDLVELARNGISCQHDSTGRVVSIYRDRTALNSKERA